MAYYSFVVIAPQPVGFTKPLLMLDKGLNTFSVVVDDVEALVERFHDEGIVVKQRNLLDEFEPGQSSDLLLDGEADLLGAPDGDEP